MPQTCLRDNIKNLIQTKLPLLPETQQYPTQTKDVPDQVMTATLDMLYKVHTST